MSKKLPYIALYTGDWMKDPNLSRCHPSTRGIWVDLLCAMHEDDRSGQVSGTAVELSRLARCTEKEFNAAMAELSDKKAAHVTVRLGKVTVTNRKMNREYKLRVGARLRKQRQRSSPGCPEDVTLLSSLSLSSSWSTDDRRVDHRCELTGEEIATVRRRANDVANKIGKRAEKPEDRSLVLKAAILSLRAPFTEHWLYDAAEGVRRASGRKQTPYGYFHKCLANAALKFGETFNTSLRRTTIPPELLEAAPKEEPLTRMCEAQPP